MLARGSLLLALGALLAACGARSSVPLDPAGDGTTRRAALAALTVENQTAQPLSIGFRVVTPPTAEIVIGAVGPRTTARMAPIFAAEPIILSARNEAGARFELAPRSFPVDAEWTWVIPRDAQFAPVQAGQP